MEDFGENEILPTYYKKSMAVNMATYRKKMNPEQKAKINEYQKNKMAERRKKQKEEKMAKGLEIKIGRPKTREGFTPKELEKMVEFLTQRVKELEDNIQKTI
jgi:flagellar biosynthesis/type III secretory pathway protein FliH